MGLVPVRRCQEVGRQDGALGSCSGRFKGTVLCKSHLQLWVQYLFDGARRWDVRMVLLALVLVGLIQIQTQIQIIYFLHFHYGTLIFIR